MFKTLLGPRQIITNNFKIFCLKTLIEGAFHREYPKSFYSVVVAGKNNFQRIYVSPSL